ncbi:hypothetical protein ACWEV3_31535 [Saccharopolyspora sp. NPDC003752]
MSLRHAEILALLAMHPGGLNAERLALLLHRGNPTTGRGEIHRIRNAFGQEVAKTRPYRIAADLGSDLDALHEALSRADAEAARRPRRTAAARSESAAIRAERDELLASLRGLALLAARSPFRQHRRGARRSGSAGKARDLTEPDAPQRKVLEFRLRRLREEEA